MNAPFGNRKQRRAAAKVERQTGGILVDPHELAKLHEMQRLFVAIVKDQGRVRVRRDTLESLTMGDRVTSKSDEAAIVLSFVGADPEEGTPA